MQPGFFVLSAMLFILLGGCAQHINAPSQPTPMPETRFRAYEPQRFSPESSAAELHAYLFTPVTLGPYPTIVVIPGGDWEHGDAADMQFVGEYLAQRGFAVVAIEHRPASTGQLETLLDDIRAGLRWTARNAREYRLDMQRVGLLGFESGGHLATLVALAQSAPQPPAGVARDPSLPPVRAVVAGGAPMNLPALEASSGLRAVLPAATDSALRAASPLSMVHADAPPFFLFHGTRDAKVPIAQAESMTTALTELGVKVEFYRMGLRGHTTTYLTVTGALQAAAQFLWRTVAEPRSERGS